MADSPIPTPPPASEGDIQEQRVLVFNWQPADLLTICALRARVERSGEDREEHLRLEAVDLPPDVTIRETFFQEKYNWMGLILESEMFDATPARYVGGKWQGEFPHTYFGVKDFSDPRLAPLQERDEDAEPEIFTPDPADYPPAPELMDELRAIFEATGKFEFRVRALTFRCADFLKIIRGLPYEWPIPFDYKDDARIIGVKKIEADLWVYWVLSEDFEPCKMLFPGEGAKREVEMEIPGDGISYTYRINLPGANATLPPAAQNRASRRKKS